MVDVKQVGDDLIPLSAKEIAQRAADKAEYESYIANNSAKETAKAEARDYLLRVAILAAEIYEALPATGKAKISAFSVATADKINQIKDGLR